MLNKEKDKEKDVSLGKSVEFHCFISKIIPLKDFFWSRSTFDRIESNEKYEIHLIDSRDFIDYQLIIHQIDSSDQGEYICSARNHYGLSQISLQLNLFSSSKEFFHSKFFYFILIGSSIISFIFIFVISISFYRNSLSNQRKSLTTSNLNGTDRHCDRDDPSNLNEYLLCPSGTFTSLNNDFHHHKYSTVV